MKNSKKESKLKNDWLMICMTITFYVSMLSMIVLQFFFGVSVVNSTIIYLIVKIIFAISAIWLLFKTGSNGLFVKIVAIATLIIMVVRLFVDHKIGAIFLTINLPLIGVAMLYEYITFQKKELNPIFGGEFFLYLVEAIRLFLSFGFEEGIIVFWIVAIIVSIVVFLIIFLYISSKREKQKIHRSIPKICFGALLIFFIVLTTVVNTNYAMDFKDPTVVSVIITEKDIDTNRRGIMYELCFKQNGNDISFYVSNTIYNSIAIGEYCNVLRYEGAYGKAFYILADK